MRPERETGILTPNWSHGKRVLKDFKKWKGDVIYVLERLPWHLWRVVGSGQITGKETNEAIAETQVTQSRGSGYGHGKVGSDQRHV